MAEPPRRGLGRGIAALLDEARSATTPEGRRAAGVSDIPIERLQPNPDQPRRAFDPEALAELTASLKAHGVVTPILVRPAPGNPGVYQIVAGERRWRAAGQAGLAALPAMVRDLDDAEVMECALVENLQRADLNPLEEARAYGVMESRFQRGAEDIARTVGKSRSHVANTLRLMKLPEAVKAHVEAGRLTAGHARALIGVDGGAALADRIVARGLSVRQAEALARTASTPAKGPRPSGAGAKDADTRDLERTLEAALGLTVTIDHRRGAGEVRVAYATLEQLDDLCERLMRPPRSKA
ncbi:MAG: ParB/RepB/Spo0J family partition protein [Caulobacteraceae bacterium]|nr:ParB/RepB/Spo0J family partition protein [Caulobacteraceae bacterium]